MTNHLPRFDAPRSAPPVASRERAETYPRESVPRAAPTLTERNRYRTRVAEQVARDAGYRKIEPPLPVVQQRRLRALASDYLKAMSRPDRERVSTRDVRHLCSRWNVPVHEAYALAAVAAGKRRGADTAAQ